MSSGDREPLFNNGFLSDVLPQQESAAFKEIDEYNQKALLETPVEALCAYFHERYLVNPIMLDEDNIHLNEEEAQLDVSRDSMRFISDRSHPFFVAASAITYIVPFTGDAELFRLSPSSSYTMNPPYGNVEDHELHLTYTEQNHDALQLSGKFTRDFGEIKTIVERQRAEVETFNTQLLGKLQQRLETRRQKLIADRQVVTSLGYPIKRRDDVPQTYAVANVQKRMPTPIPVPPNTIPASEHDPMISMDAYESILKTISDMAVVLERSPSAFRSLGEEDLRWQFLVALNGIFEGQATGETFNSNGKTDILIRQGNSNLFVAECKFWGGEKLFGETVDQLLGYLTWRDTKAAILIFNRNKGFSTVVNTIQASLPKHPQFLRSLPFGSETGCRAAISLPGDPNREIIVTVLAFDVPT